MVTAGMRRGAAIRSGAASTISGTIGSFAEGYKAGKAGSTFTTASSFGTLGHDIGSSVKTAQSWIMPVSKGATAEVAISAAAVVSAKAGLYGHGVVNVGKYMAAAAGFVKNIALAAGQLWFKNLAVAAIVNGGAAIAKPVYKGRPGDR